MSKFEIEYFSFLSIKPWIWLGFHTGMELWDYGMGRRIHRFEEFESPIRCLDFHRSLPLLFSGGDKTVSVWNIGAVRKNKKVSPIPLRKITTVFVSADEVIHFGQKKSLFFSRVNAILKNIHDNGTEWAALHRSIPPIFSVSDDSQLKMMRMNDTEGLAIHTLQREEFNYVSVIYVKDRLFELLSQAWVSWTAVLAFCTANFGVIAVDSKGFFPISMTGGNGFFKLIFISNKMVLGGSGRGNLVDEVKAQLPDMLRGIDYENVAEAIEGVIRAINHTLIDSIPRETRNTRNYRAWGDTFVLLCLVNKEFGLVRIGYKLDGIAFEGERFYEGCINAGCGALPMERYQRDHPFPSDDEAEVTTYAINCIIAAAKRRPHTIGGNIYAFVISREEGFSTLNTCYLYGDDVPEGGVPGIEMTHYRH